MSNFPRIFALSALALATLSATSFGQSNAPAPQPSSTKSAEKSTPESATRAEFPVQTPATTQDSTPAPTPDKRKYEIGIDVGAYIPTDSHLKNVFGSEVFKFGADFGPRRAIRNGAFVPSVGLISANRNGSDFYLAQAMLSYEIRIAKPHFVAKDLLFEPYAKASVGAAYADYSLTDGNNIHTAAKRGLPTSQLLVGFMLGSRVRFTASYNFFESVDGYNFNGYSLSLAYVLFRI